MRAPFPYFGGKSRIAATVWDYLGTPKHYIEPFCGSAAVLLAAPKPCALEVVNDRNCFLANFWRSVKHQPSTVAEWADYPVSHIDLGARHRWLLEQWTSAAEALQDPDWPGDAKIAGWWLWGQCCWIGSGWCDQDKAPHIGNAGRGVQAIGKVPHISDAGRGVQAIGKVPHISDAGRGVQAIGQVPHIGNAGRGVQAIGQVPHIGNAGMGTAGQAAEKWLGELSRRLDRVRIICGDWGRCLNSTYGGDDTGIFFDPPYSGTEGLYGVGSTRVVDDVVAWCREHDDLKIVIAGHAGDYDLQGWRTVGWERGGLAYGGGTDRDKECLWVSPACEDPSRQLGLF